MADEIEQEAEKILYDYWMSTIKRSLKKQPIDKWEDAEKRLKCGQDASDNKDDRGNREKPYVNSYRLHYENLKSFLDQTEPTFKVSPNDPFMDDIPSIKFAECDYEFLKYVWKEQNCQIAQSKKLDSTLVRNVGYTMPGFDKKKWLPNIRWLAAKDVILDVDCGGDQERAGFIGYREPISLEELKAKHVNLTDDEIKRIRDKGGSSLSEEDKKDVSDGLQKLYVTVTLYHIFARNDAAIREMTSGQGEEQEIPTKTLAEDLNLSTPRRYLQFVEGYHKPLVDMDEWPYELDDNEFPITSLSFNTLAGNNFSFTDYEQMERLDRMGDNIMYDIENASYWEANKKFASGQSTNVTEVEIQAFLNTTKKHFLANFLDADGNPKIKQIDTGKFESALVQAHEYVMEQTKVASALGELLGSEAREYKDVTAIAARIHDANVHQKVNRRLGGPQGYEVSIAEDAIKILEIAHQFMPKYSVVEIPFDFGEGETMDYITLPWEQAQQMLLRPGTTLVQLGVDSIVGEELAQYWRTTEEYPVRLFKLATKVKVMPGSTRSVTKEHKAAVMKQYYLEAFFPMFQAMNRMDLAIRFLSYIGQLAGVDNVDDKLPKPEEVQQWMKQQKEMAKAQAEAEIVKGGGTPPSLGGEEGLGGESPLAEGQV